MLLMCVVTSSVDLDMRASTCNECRVVTSSVAVRACQQCNQCSVVTSSVDVSA